MDTEPVADWIVPGAELKTRGGYKVRIYAVDGGGTYPVHGAVFNEGRWAPQSWSSTGIFEMASAPSANDLMEPVRRKIAYVSMDSVGKLHFSIKPNAHRKRHIVGSIKVEVVEGEFAVGEGG